MARVVQRRGTPPYLLILFVLLFLTATTLAVLFYVRYDEKIQQLTTSNSRLRDQRRKVSDEKKQKDQLIAVIVGRDAEGVKADAAAAAAKEALTGPHAKAWQNDGLAAAVGGLEELIGDPQTKTSGFLKDIGDLNVRVSSLEGTIKQKDAAIKNAQGKYDKLATDSAAQLAKARNGFQAALKAKDNQLQRAVDQQKTDIADKDRRISVLAQEMEQARNDIRERDRLIQKYLQEIADRRPKAQTGAQPRRPDGKILKALLDQQIVYVDIGEKDHAKPGLPLAVYSSQTGIPADGVGKAQIVVNNVFSTTSECRIVKAKKDDPIIEGDLVANVVFDPARSYKFVVEGDFDIYGEGRTDPRAKEYIRTMIDRLGGKLVDEIAVSTDFVVLGEEPPRPPRPEADAPPGDWQLYTQKMKKYDDYTRIKGTALRLQIPIMNTTRFLAFTGLVPMKRLVEQ